MAKKHAIKQNKDGAALIMVLCILCVFLALALAMIFMSYQVLSSAQRSATKEQCRVSAVSFNEVLQKEITNPDGVKNKADTVENIRDYLYQQIKGGSWPYYNTEEKGHEKLLAYRTIDVSGMSQAMQKHGGDIETTIYWESEEGSDFDDMVLVTIVTSTFRKETYSVKTRYVLLNDEQEEGHHGDNWIWTVTWQGN